MIQVTSQMKILVAIMPADFRKGIDGISRLCSEVLKSDPFSGTVFVFRNRRATAKKLLLYDGQGFWLAHKRLSSGHYSFWPSGTDKGMTTLEAHQLQVLIFAGDPYATGTAPMWRPVVEPK